MLRMILSIAKSYVILKIGDAVMNAFLRKGDGESVPTRKTARRTR